jgi:hypothetical protein
VDRTNITRELERYQSAGMGGVHIIPIYGAKGWESQSISYLSPQWMEMLRHTITEARRLDLDVDMTAGTGWCFGGPEVTDLEANASVVVKTSEVRSGERLAGKFDVESVQALVAFADAGECLELTERIQPDGTVDWTAPHGTWHIYVVSQRPAGRQVKRAAPGGEGHMLNLFYAPGMRHYLERFERAFAAYDGPKPRAMYHDSYEYISNWSPDLFEQFEKRRGYRLQTELPALFGRQTNQHTARVRCDYRETLSDLMAEETLPQWAKWCRDRGLITRNQAHGSPGNLLDLYALADIPESEMFHADRNPLISKFASSAAHVAGRPLVAAETGTWLKEHFTETLADMKYLLDDMFVSGVNQVFYAGTCYSPDEAAWPGWLFYASYEMNPRNAIWRDGPALNAYAARCQSVLQRGRPDNDILLYWPIHDFWHDNGKLEQKLTIHRLGWFDHQPIGAAAAKLWQRGFTFDYISDRQLAGAAASNGNVEVPGGKFRVIAVPQCAHIPLETITRLISLAKAGATVIFDHDLPQDVPGWGSLEKRRMELRKELSAVTLTAVEGTPLRCATVGKGRILAGDLEAALDAAHVRREPLVDQPGLHFVRRCSDAGRDYFVANRGERPFDGWLPLATDANSVAILDALSGRTGLATIRHTPPGRLEVYVQLQPGGSLILRALGTASAAGPRWTWPKPKGATSRLEGSWQVKFRIGGPQLPAPFATARLVSWTELGGEEAQRFAGTACYSLNFDAPGKPASDWLLDLGGVCQSARVRLNGRELGTLLAPPFQVAVCGLMPAGNLLEVEVTNVSANRIRDLDRRKVAWKNFHDANFVSIDPNKPFDASNWPVANSGLLGPVTLTPIQAAVPSDAPVEKTK